MGKVAKSVLVERVRGLSFWQAYRACRRVGEYPWCSLRIAAISR
jgi:hypothetical protein